MPFDFFFCITLLLRDLLGSISNKFCKVVIGESLNTWPKACASATKVRVPKVNLSRKRLMRRSALAFLFAATDGTLFVHEALLSCNRHIFYILDSKQHSSISRGGDRGGGQGPGPLWSLNLHYKFKFWLNFYINLYGWPPPNNEKIAILAPPLLVTSAVFTCLSRWSSRSLPPTSVIPG